MRAAALTIGLVLLSGSLVACGGSDSSSTDAGSGAQINRFCATYAKLDKGLGDVDAQKLEKDAAARRQYVARLKSAVGELKDLGAPSTISEQAERGFESSIAQIEALPDRPTAAQLTNPAPVSASDQKDQAAFGVYLKVTCPDVAVPE